MHFEWVPCDLDHLTQGLDCQLLTELHKQHPALRHHSLKVLLCLLFLKVFVLQATLNVWHQMVDQFGKQVLNRCPNKGQDHAVQVGIGSPQANDNAN